MQRLFIHVLLYSCAWWATPLLAQSNTAQSTMTLAATCAACHGPQGNSLGGTPTLAALNKEYFIQRMQSFKNGSTSSTVMHHHAKGLTDEEITAIAIYFSALPRITPSAAPRQPFVGAQ